MIDSRALLEHALDPVRARAFTGATVADRKSVV